MGARVCEEAHCESDHLGSLEGGWRHEALAPVEVRVEDIGLLVLRPDVKQPLGAQVGILSEGSW